MANIITITAGSPPTCWTCGKEGWTTLRWYKKLQMRLCYNCAVRLGQEW